ncbi:MAG: SPASM domain-containing protein [Candidatus Aminicenantes bacterium]|nr:MAG: SPASM domain-containing protein [Candidatus Aminicenantes bacterium]
MNKFQYHRRLINLFSSYKKKKKQLSYLPVRLWIEPTNHCNLQCVMCPNKQLKKEEKGYMDFKLFKKIIDEASTYVIEANLLHRGESLLHPDIIQMAKYAREKDLKTKLHTNGTLLSNEISYKLIESGIDYLTFSFDGYDKDTYESIRVKGNFEETISNIVGFLKIKEELNSKKPFTTLELINLPNSNKKNDLFKRKDFLNRFKGLPLDKVKIKEMHNWAGIMSKNQSFKTFSHCTFLWYALAIFWDGSVLPCPQDFFGSYIVGNVRDSSLAEIWNNEKMKALRNKMGRREISDLKTCGDCDRLWRKRFLGVPKEYLWKFLLKKMT